MVLFPLPAQVVEFAEGKENQRRAGQQGDQAQGAPKYRFAGQGVAGQRVVGEIIGIRIVFTRSLGHRGPGGPGKKGGELAKLLGIVNEVLPQPAIGGRVREIIAPAANLPRKGNLFRFLEEQGAGGGIVLIGFQKGRHFGSNRFRFQRAELFSFFAVNLMRQQIGGVRGQTVQIVGAEVRAEIGAVPPDRAIIHQAVLQKHLLAGADIGAGKNRPSS